jgi:hypothetical protein
MGTSVANGACSVRFPPYRPGFYGFEMRQNNENSSAKILYVRAETQAPAPMRGVRNERKSIPF